MIVDPGDAIEVDVKVTVCPGSGAAGENVNPAIRATDGHHEAALPHAGRPALSVTRSRTTFSPSLA